MSDMEKLRQLSLLIKPASSLCNLRCRYCFYEDESENRSQKCYGIMDAPTTDRLIASAAEALAFRTDNGRLPDPCTACNWLPICHGGCKKDITAGCHNEPENYFCPAYRFFFEYASERLIEMARAELRAIRNHK